MPGPAGWHGHSVLVGELPVFGHGGHVVRAEEDLFLEQLVHSAVRQLPAGSGQPLALELELLGREQALPSGVGAGAAVMSPSAVRW